MQFAPDYGLPEALTEQEISGLRDAYVTAAQRAAAADVDLIEIHAAHGYLLHSFLCPMTNQRNDAYGGSLEARARLTLEITQAVRDIWPQEKPLAVRLTAIDHHIGGVTQEDGLWLAARLGEIGVDLLDVTTGNLIPDYTAPVYPGYQVQYAEKIRQATGLAVSSVGSLASADLIEEIIGLKGVKF